MKTANARFAIKTWDEKPYSEAEGQPRLTRASVSKTFSGDLEGEGSSAVGQGLEHPLALDYDLA